MVKYRNTTQRNAIMQYLQGNKSHPSAEDIYRAVIKRHPAISLATVYNTLDMLKKKGLVAELAINSPKKRYDPNTFSHHHFICLRCNDIFDIEEPINVDVPEQINRFYEIVSKQVDLYGYCMECKDSQIVYTDNTSEQSDLLKNKSKEAL